MIVEKKAFELPRYTTADGAHDQERRGRLGELRHAQCRQVQRHADHALLLRHQPRGGKYYGGRQVRRLLGRHHRARQGDRHRQVLRLSSDTLVNLNVNEPNVVTTGPA